ncbi:MAG: cytochrome P450 [Acidimicrobiia bacterium]|nr:cytochrome P450 [Acidimicrobiia bacterium]
MGNALPTPALRRQPRLLQRLLRDPSPVLDELRDELGPIYGLGAGPARMAVVGDPVALRELFAMPAESFRWKHKFNVLGFVVGPGSMIVSDGPDHTRRRKSVQTAFSRRRLNGWIPTIVERTDAAIEGVFADLPADGAQIDMYPIGRALVLDIVVRALFGPRMAPHTATIGELFERPQAYLESSFLAQLPHPFPYTRRARVAADRRALDAIIDAQIDDRRREPSGDPTDVLEALVIDGTLSDSEIRDQVATLIGAGYDTTAASLAWMLTLCARSPEVWKRLGDEADRVFGSAVDVDHVTLAALEFADRTMRETLRLHPAGVVSPREAATDVTVGGYSVPKGTLILWSAYLAGRDATAWTDPLEFRPDRFVEATAEQKSLADISWVPFGRGARNCIGFALAQMELTLIVARLAQRLSISATGPVPPPRGMVVNRPEGGAPMRVSARGETVR